jgi:hypothetical protein
MQKLSWNFLQYNVFELLQVMLYQLVLFQSHWCIFAVHHKKEILKYTYKYVYFREYVSEVQFFRRSIQNAYHT